MKRRKIILVVLAIAAVCAAAGLVLTLNRPKPVVFISISPEPTERVLAVVGRVRPTELVNVLAENPGQIIRMLHDEGDQVAAAAPLAVIKSTVEQAQADADSAGAAAARARVTEAQQNLTRTTTLFDRGFASQAALDQARAAANTAEAELAAAAAQYRAAIERTREFVVTAPMAGTILARPIDNGQVVSTTTTLFELAAMSGFEIEAEVDEAYADRVRTGMAARVSPSGSTAVYTALVTEVSPKVDATTGGRRVRLTPEAIPGLTPGRSLDVTIVVSPAERLIVVPRQAIVDATVAPKVYVIGDDDVVRVQPVQIANWPSINAIVTSGLSGGERIVLSPAKTKPGAHVRPVRAGP